MKPSMQLRRKFLIALPALLTLVQGNLSAQENSPTMIDGSDIKDVRELVAVVRKLMGDRVPKHLTDERFYEELARETVANIQLAISDGVQIPSFMLGRQSSQETNGSTYRVGFPVLMFFTLFGMRFAMPVATFFRIILSSLWIMYIYLSVQSERQTSKAKPGNSDIAPKPKVGKLIST